MARWSPSAVSSPKYGPEERALIERDGRLECELLADARRHRHELSMKASRASHARLTLGSRATHKIRGPVWILTSIFDSCPRFGKLVYEGHRAGLRLYLIASW